MKNKKLKKSVYTAGRKPISNEHILIVIIGILFCTIGLLITK
jgi:hypothetical protein